MLTLRAAAFSRTKFLVRCAFRQISSWQGKSAVRDNSAFAYQTIAPPCFCGLLEAAGETNKWEWRGPKIGGELYPPDLH